MVGNPGKLLPGIVVLVVGAILARTLSGMVGFHELLVAIAIGVLAANMAGIPDTFRPGIGTHTVWLAAGIVLLGASLTLEAILEIGPTLLLVLIAVVITTVATGELVARRIGGLSARFGSMLAAGAGICGVSAVVAVGGAISARDTQIAYAAGVILLVDAISIVVFPLAGALLNLPDIVFGIWVGISMLSTGPVVAVGFAYSETAGQWATLTKLARNALIGGVALGYGVYYARSTASGATSLRTLHSNVPAFIWGFFLLVVLASAGVFSTGEHATMEQAVHWLFLLAFVGLGAEIQFDELRSVGATPALVVIIAMLVASALSLVLALLLFGVA